MLHGGTFDAILSASDAIIAEVMGGVEKVTAAVDKCVRAEVKKLGSTNSLQN